MAQHAPSPEIQQARRSLAQGDYRTAIRIGERAVALNRKDVEALVLLADVAASMGGYAEEVDHVQKAIAVEPKHPMLRARLGHLLMVTGDFPKALLQFEKALKLHSGHPVAVCGLATLHERKGRYDRALKVLQPCLRGGRVPPEIAAVAVRVLIHEERLDEVIALARRTIDSKFPPSQSLRVVLFTLARAHELRGEYEDAFRIAQEANGMAAPTFDRDATRRQTDRIIEVFSRDLVASMPRPSEPSDLPVFIVGMPRCGSTLAERVLHAHPDAHGADEIDTLHRVLGDARMSAGVRETFPERFDTLTAPIIEAAAASYVQQLRMLAPKAKRISNKHLGNTLHLGAINVLFPHARVIHCRRDPIDCCLSCVMSPLSLDQVPYVQNLESLAFSYREYQRLMIHWREVLDVPVLELDYESLVSDQEATSRRMIDFCGLEWNDACLRHHEVDRPDRTVSFDQVRRPIYGSSVGRAERFAGAADSLREALRVAGVEPWPPAS